MEKSVIHKDGERRIDFNQAGEENPRGFETSLDKLCSERKEKRMKMDNEVICLSDGENSGIIKSNRGR